MLIAEKTTTLSVTEEGAEGLANYLVVGLLAPKEFGVTNNAHFFSYLKTVLLDDTNPIGKYAYPMLKLHRHNSMVLGLIGEVATIRTMRKCMPFVAEPTYTEDTIDKIDCYIGSAPVQIKTTNEELLHTAVYSELQALYDLALVYLQLQLDLEGHGYMFMKLRSESSSLISSFGNGRDIPPEWEMLRQFWGEAKKPRYNFILRMFETVYTLEQLKMRNEGALVIIVSAHDIDWDNCELNEQGSLALFSNIL